MGRLFWKCFFASWLTMMLAGFVTFTGVRIYRSIENTNILIDASPRSRFELDSAAAVLRHAGPAVLAATLDEIDSDIVVMDPAGAELRGKPLTAPLTDLATKRRAWDSPEGMLRVPMANGVFTLLVPARHHFPPGREVLGPPAKRPAPWEPLAAIVLGSIVLSGLLAWYLARPVRSLLAAFTDMTEGRLDTRVHSRMHRRDEFSELGRSFDRMAEKLQNLILAQRRLLHDVSHELRSPLGRLHVALGIIRQAPDKTETTLARMESEVNRLDGLIEEILTLSRLNSGVENNITERVDMGELVEELVRDARFEALDKGCEVRLEEHAQPVIQGRPGLISRALDNILRNGLKFSPAGGILNVEIRLEGAFAVVSVTDTGPGIPEDELDTIFQPFHRGRNNPDASGFGLGLAIARAAADLHGGTVTARNIPAGGLCMELRFPAEHPLDNDTSSPA